MVPSPLVGSVNNILLIATKTVIHTHHVGTQLLDLGRTQLAHYRRDFLLQDVDDFHNPRCAIRLMIYDSKIAVTTR